MNYVRCNHGMGNQMFQYAFMLAMRKHGTRDIRMLYGNGNVDGHYGYELERAFGIGLELDVWSWLLSFKHSKLIRLLFERTHHIVEQPGKGTRYLGELFANEYHNTIFSGFWQNLKYIEGCEQIIKSELRFRTDNINDYSSAMLEAIDSCNAVSVHIRRGDYLNLDMIEYFGSNISDHYYKDAVNYLESRFDNLHFFFFSDDIAWVKENFKGDNVSYVDGNLGEDSWQDMLLMSRCKYNIIANSSFSWWGAFLNDNPSKIVIAPKKWLFELDSDYIVPGDWIRFS